MEEDEKSIYKLLLKLGRSTVVLAVADDAAPAQLITLIFVDELVLHKNG